MQMRRHRYSVLPTTKHAILSLTLLCTWRYFICMILRTLTRHFDTDEPQLDSASTNVASSNIPRVSAAWNQIYCFESFEISLNLKYVDFWIIVTESFRFRVYIYIYICERTFDRIEKWRFRGKRKKKTSTLKMLRPGYVFPLFSEVRKSTKKFRSKLKTTSYFGWKERLEDLTWIVWSSSGG